MGTKKKRAETELGVAVNRQGEAAACDVHVVGNPEMLLAGFEAICRGLLQSIAKNEDGTFLTFAADLMERALRDAVKEVGAKSPEEQLRELLKGFPEMQEEENDQLLN